MLCKEAVIEWKSIYEEQTGQEIGFEEATLRANRMFRFIKTITKPSSSSKLKSKKGDVKNGQKTTSKKVRRN